MGACKSKEKKASGPRPNVATGDGREKTFRLGQHTNTADTVVTASSHSLQGLGDTETGGKVAFTNHHAAVNDSRRDSLNIPRGFFLSLNVPYEDITFDLKMGSGTFGQVFKAHVQGKRCAVKQLFLHGDAQERLEILTDFGKECQIMSLMHHPNIVQFWGSVQEAPNFCLITELCEGSVVDLLQLVRIEKVNVTWRLLKNITSGAAEAMKYLHYDCETQIIHRDLKAENLLLDRKFVCKLTDFGLSRIISEGEANKTSHMTMCGTPSWVAPEIFKGEAYNHKIDVYSFGVVMWELCCFRKPYIGENPVKLPFRVALQNLRPPISPHIPEFFAKVMCDCWDGDPAKRPDFKEITERLMNAEKLLQEKGSEGQAPVDLDEAVDITKVSNNIYKAQKKEMRAAAKIAIPGEIVEDDEEKG